MDIQTNTFVKGMDRDTDIHLLSQDTYRYAENIRIVTNDDGTTGVLSNINGVQDYYLNDPEDVLGHEYIMYVGSIGEYIYLITEVNSTQSIYRVNRDDKTLKCVAYGEFGWNEHIKVVANKESKDIIKLYICDGVKPIRVFNLLANSSNAPVNPGDYDIVPDANLSAPVFGNFTTGKLKAGSYQYCYQLFNDRGNSTLISSLSRIIQVYDLKGDNYTDKNTKKSININIQIDSDAIDNFNYIRIYRIYYKDITEDPEVNIATELPLSNDTIRYNDTDNTILSSITIEELNSIKQNIVAATIETKDNILFAANTKDTLWDIEYDARAYRFSQDKLLLLQSSSNDTIQKTISNVSQLRDLVPYDHDCIQPKTAFIRTGEETGGSSTEVYLAYNLSGQLGGTGLNVSYTFNIDSTIVLDNVLKSSSDTLNDNLGISREVHTHIPGYMRGETYRFGIVFYNSKHQSTPVHWIADIRMPSYQELPPFYLYDSYLQGKPLYINFTVNNIPQEAIGYEIVRCERKGQDRSIIMQGVLSGIVSIDNNNKIPTNAQQLASEKDYRPSAILTFSNNYAIKTDNFVNLTNSSYYSVLRGIKSNYHTLISPEIDFSDSSIKDIFNNASIEILGWVTNAVEGVTISSYNDYTRVFLCPRYLYKSWEATATYDNSSRCGIISNSSNSNVKNKIVLNVDDHNTVPSLISKKYVTYFNESNNTYNIHQCIYSNLLKQNQYTDMTPYYQPIGDVSYISFATTTTEYNKDNWTAHAKIGYYGKSIVVNTDNIDIYPTLPTNSNIKATSKYSEAVRTYNTLFTSLPIVNIINNTTQYGGNTYVNRTNSTYISIGEYYNSRDEQITVKGGDTYVDILDHKTCSPVPNVNDDKFNQKDQLISVVDYIPFETTVLLDANGGQNNSSSFNGNNINPYLSTTIEQGMLGDYNVQTKPYYSYNDAYSVEPYVKVFVDKGLYALTDISIPNRIYASQVKIANELQDNWCIFKPSDYLDVDNKYGKITNLKLFKDRLVFFQDQAVGVASVNERSLITDNNISQLTLGTGTILARYDYITHNNGSSIVNDKSIADSYYGLYWFDKDKNEICQYAESVAKLSKQKNIQSDLNRRSIQVYDAYYDNKYNEVCFSTNINTLVYNERAQAFTSYYTFTPDFHISFSDKLFYIKDSHLYEEAENSLVTSKIQLVVNKNPLQTKTFDNVFMYGYFSNINDIISNVQFNTKSQTSSFLRDIDGNYIIDYREDTYRFAIGRQENNNDDMSYSGRLKGKYLICDYTFDCEGNNFSLPSISTTFRQSLV